MMTFVDQILDHFLHQKFVFKSVENHERKLRDFIENFEKMRQFSLNILNKNKRPNFSENFEVALPFCPKSYTIFTPEFFLPILFSKNVFHILIKKREIFGVKNGW